jgi:hypothetical protein
MTERITSKYQRLFELRLLHHYWLDEGATIFDLLEETKQEQRLLTYDRRPFLALAPTAATTTALRGLGCVYRDTALGCLVALPEGRAVPPETTWEFIVTVLDATFFNYTALTLRSRRVYEFYHQADEVTYRYKENVPVLSNQTGVAQVVNARKQLFLSQAIPATITPEATVESLFRVAGGLVQLTSDAPGATQEPIGEDATLLPVYVHQDDSPELTPPGGLSGVPVRGIRLSADIPDPVFALIRLSALGSDDADFSFVDNSGQAKTEAPIYQVRFKNRLTFRRYIPGAEDDPHSPLPLTWFGNAGTKQKPSAGLMKVERSNGRITQLVSEIYV